MKYIADIAGEVENLLVEYPEAGQRFREQLRIFNDVWREYWTAKGNELQPLTEQPDKSIEDAYECDTDFKVWFPKGETQLPPDPTKWGLDDKLPCYYGPLAVIYDQVKGEVAPYRLCAGVLDNFLFAWMQKLLARTSTYDKDKLDTALKWVKRDIKSISEAEAKTNMGGGTPEGKAVAITTSEISDDDKAKLDKCFVRAAGIVDRWVLNYPEVMAEFRKQIRPLADDWQAHHRDEAEYDKNLREHFKRVKKNPALQNKKARPKAAKKDWSWDPTYLGPLLYEITEEMPARYAEDVVLGIRRYLAKAYSGIHTLAMLGRYPLASQTREYQELEYASRRHKQNIEEIEGQLKSLSPKQRRKVWIKSPPLNPPSNVGYVRFWWFRYLNLPEEAIFGCWGPPLVEIRPEPLQTLIPEEVEGTLPDVNTQQEYERYYVVLTSIHDNRLAVNSTRIADESNWPPKLAEWIWGRFTDAQPYGPDKTFIEQALEHVKHDLKDKELLDGKERERTEMTIQGPAHTNPAVKNHGEFLINVANTIHKFVQKASNRESFQEQLRGFRKLKDDFAHTLKKAQEAALSDPALRYDYDDGRDEDKAPPDPPKDGYEVERHYVLDDPPKGFWRPPLPFNPDGWLQRFECSWFGLFDPPAEEPRDKAQMLMCEYALFATIHDTALDNPACDRLTDSGQDDWADSLWIGVRQEGTFTGDISTFPHRQAYIKTSLTNVINDLAVKATEKQLGSGEMNETEDDSDGGSKNKADKLLEIAGKLSIWRESTSDDQGKQNWTNLSERGLKAARASLCLLRENADLLNRCKHNFGPMNSECEQAISNLNSLLSGMRTNNEPPEQIEERYGWGDQFALHGFIEALRRWAEESSRATVANLTRSHSKDFRKVTWDGQEYSFNRNRAIAIRLLWKAYEDPEKVGVNQSEIGEALDSVSTNYRLQDTFRVRCKDRRAYHPAWKKMIEPVGSGVYRLRPLKTK